MYINECTTSRPETAVVAVSENFTLDNFYFARVYEVNKTLSSSIQILFFVKECKSAF